MGLSSLPEPARGTCVFAAPPEIDEHLREAANVYADTQAVEKIKKSILLMARALR